MGVVPVNDLGTKKVALFKLSHTKRILADSLVLCMFFPYSFQQLADLVAGVTGWDTGVGELMKAADRTLTVARLFNNREGFTSADDTLPDRFFEGKTDGVLADKPLNRAKFEHAVEYYYTLMGWDSHTGVPLQDKVEELEIA